LVDPEARTPLAGEPNRADPPSPVVWPHSAQTNPAVTLDRFLMLCHTSLTRFPPGFRPGVPRLASSGDPPPRERAPVTFPAAGSCVFCPFSSWPPDPRSTDQNRNRVPLRPEPQDPNLTVLIRSYRFSLVILLKSPRSFQVSTRSPPRGSKIIASRSFSSCLTPRAL
jgi:hypothetical protein